MSVSDRLYSIIASWAHTPIWWRIAWMGSVHHPIRRRRWALVHPSYHVRYGEYRWYLAIIDRSPRWFPEHNSQFHCESGSYRLAQKQECSCVVSLFRSSFRPIDRFYSAFQTIRRRLTSIRYKNDLRLLNRKLHPADMVWAVSPAQSMPSGFLQSILKTRTMSMRVEQVRQSTHGRRL